jgi:hypothetical protein
LLAVHVNPAASHLCGLVPRLLSTALLLLIRADSLLLLNKSLALRFCLAARELFRFTLGLCFSSYASGPRTLALRFGLAACKLFRFTLGLCFSS